MRSTLSLFTLAGAVTTVLAVVDTMNNIDELCAVNWGDQKAVPAIICMFDTRDDAVFITTQGKTLYGGLSALCCKKGDTCVREDTGTDQLKQATCWNPVKETLVVAYDPSPIDDCKADGSGDGCTTDDEGTGPGTKYTTKGMITITEVKDGKGVVDCDVFKGESANCGGSGSGSSGSGSSGSSGSGSSGSGSKKSGASSSVVGGCGLGFAAAVGFAAALIL